MNWPTIITLAVVAAVFGAVLFNEIRKKKQGAASCACSGNCGSCGCGCGK